MNQALVRIVTLVLLALPTQSKATDSDGAHVGGARAVARIPQSRTVEVLVAAKQPAPSSNSCHIRLRDSYGAAVGEGGYWRATIPNVKSKYNKLGFSFMCMDTRSDDWKRGLAVRFDAKTKMWVKDMSERITPLYSARTVAQLDNATRVYNFRSVNGQGFAITEDDTSGDDARRERMLDFCVVREPKTLCGRGRVMQLREPKSDLLPYALKVIQSIEFLE